MIHIRKARIEDLEQLKEIQNDYIQNSTVHWVNELRDDEDMKRWFNEHNEDNRPLIVAQQDDVIIGYASLSTFRNNQGWGNLTENSIYIKNGYYRQGIGHLLMRELINLAKQANVWGITSWIDTENIGSIKFHNEFGFETKMVYENFGEKFGKKRSSVVMILNIENQ
jgi:phosphinothricin acetyltransferase